MPSLLLSLLLFAHSALGFAATPPLKPFKRALVLSGGSLRTGAFLGTIAGLKERGWEPDVILTTCGASMAGSIAHLSTDPATWKTFVESEEYYEYLSSIKPNPAYDTGNEIVAPFFSILKKQTYEKLWGPSARKIPDLFSVNVVDLPTTTKLSLGQAYFKAQPTNRLIILAGELQFGPEDVGKPIKGKLLDQVFFTDPETAEHLRKIVPAAAKNFPSGYLSDQVKVYSEATLYEAARASMAEPYLVQGMKITLDGEERTFVAGSIDSYPIELASTLADEVIAAAAGTQGPLEEIVFKEAYGFDIHDRLKQTQSQTVAHWIDYSDIGAKDDQIGYGPKLKIDGEKLKVGNLSALEMAYELPELEEYKRRVEQWWEHGRERALEALQTPESSREHLRDDVLATLANLKFQNTHSKVVGLFHTWQAPAIATVDLLDALSELPEQDDESSSLSNLAAASGRQAPFLVAHLLASLGMEWARNRFLDYRAPTQHPPRKTVIGSTIEKRFDSLDTSWASLRLSPLAV